MSSERSFPLAGLLLCALGVFLAGCRSDTGADSGSETTEVVAYVAHDLLYSGPILAEFERRTGIHVRIVGDTEATKTTGLANRLLQLRDRPEADVFWSNEVMRMAQLADEGLLQPFVPASATGIPTRHCDPAGRWTGFAARARVILYNTELLEAQDAPKSILDLTEPRFRGKVAIANPLFGTTATHVAALFEHLGPEKAREYLLALKGNDVEVAAGNAMARNMVMNGEIPICLTDTDDANGAIEKGKPVAMVYPDQEGMGTLVIPNSVGLIRGGPHIEEGKELVEFLVSAEVEELLARSKAAQMPLRPGIPPHDAQFDLSGLKTLEVDWSRVAARARESALFVEEVFLD